MHDTQEAEPMAKRKKPKLGRPPKPEESKDARLSMRVRQEWLDWLDAFAEDQRLGQAVLVDQALAAYAEMKQFKKPPKR